MKKKLIIGLVITVLFITYFARVYYVNATGGRIEKVEYAMGQTAEYNNYLYTVKSTRVLNLDELNQEFNLNIKNGTSYEIKYIVTEIEMEYTGDIASPVCPLLYATYQSGAWHNGETDAFSQINANSMNMEKGKKYTLYTAGGLTEIGFSKDDWKKVNDMKFELVLSTYPKEIVLKCN